jgi:hypothetical protein
MLTTTASNLSKLSNFESKMSKSIQVSIFQQRLFDRLSLSVSNEIADPASFPDLVSRHLDSTHQIPNLPEEKIKLLIFDEEDDKIILLKIKELKHLNRQSETDFDIMKSRLRFAILGTLSDDYLKVTHKYENIIVYSLSLPLWFMSYFSFLNNALEQLWLVDDILNLIDSQIYFPKLHNKKLLQFLDQYIDRPLYVNQTMELLSAKRKVSGIKMHQKQTQRALETVNDPGKIADLRLILAKSEHNLQCTEMRINQLIDTLNLSDSQSHHQPTALNNPLPNADDAIIAHPSMDGGEQPNEVSNDLDQSMNTALATTSDEIPVIVTDSPPNMDFVDEILTDQTHSYPDLTSRFVLLTTIRLNTMITAGTVIRQFHLPAEYIISNWLNPSCLPFQTYEFFTGSMELKFQWNIPKTNQFYLRFGSVYHYLERDRRTELVNAWSISQQPGGRLNSHIANSDVLTLPFTSYMPTIPIRPNSTALNLYYVTVSLIAMTDFEIAEGATPSSNLNVYFKFKNDLKFYGLRQPDPNPPSFTIPAEPQSPTQKPTIIAHPSMMAIAAGAIATTASDAASGIVNSVIGTANSVVRKTLSTATGVITRTVEKGLSQALPPKRGNRDKPRDHHNQPLHQRAATNIASGSGTFQAESLRLVEAGETPHPDFLLGVEKYDSITQIIQTLGFINSFKVRTSNLAETLLASFLIQPSTPNQITFGANFPSGIINFTPLDHLASWFALYHGKTVYHFECVADGFKTCRLLICYIPNSLTCTYEQAKCAYYQTFDLGSDLDTQQSFDFEVPYIHNFNNFPMHFSNINATTGGGSILAGSIHVFLEIPISAPSTMYPSFDVLVSKRAVPGQMAFTIPRPNMTMLRIDDSDLPDVPGPPPPVHPDPRTMNFSIVLTDFTLVGPNWSANLRIITPFGSALRSIGTLNPEPLPFILTSDSFASTFNASLTSQNSLTISTQSTSTPVTATVFLRFLQGNESFNISTNHVVNAIPTQWSVTYTGPSPIVTMFEEEEEIIPSMDIRETRTENIDLTHSLVPFTAALHGEDNMD